ncbi:uncharacterized protein LOC118410090 [Branchiostoma floridae]|uniref:Uncharacterized protein LOC118410090 n=1 Tax=Branchiostoma floridae TaxID=7739 RepID=A0A9J7KNV1_BRAFL|nr:uncharacterized protein LOC118410090 [Branchiostoma floridae]
MNYRYLADRTFGSSAGWISRHQRASTTQNIHNKLQTVPRARRGSHAARFSQPLPEGLMWFPGKRFRCGEDDCDKEFPTMRGLAFHLRSHNRPMRYYRCKRCGFRSQDKILVDLHRVVFHNHPYRRHRSNSSAGTECSSRFGHPHNSNRSTRQGSVGDTGCSDVEYNGQVRMYKFEDRNNNTENTLNVNKKVN